MDEVFTYISRAAQISKLHHEIYVIACNRAGIHLYEAANKHSLSISLQKAYDTRHILQNALIEMMRGPSNFQKKKRKK